MGDDLPIVEYIERSSTHKRYLFHNVGIITMAGISRVRTYMYKRKGEMVI